MYVMSLSNINKDTVRRTEIPSIIENNQMLHRTTWDIFMLFVI